MAKAECESEKVEELICNERNLYWSLGSYYVQLVAFGNGLCVVRVATAR